MRAGNHSRSVTLILTVILFVFLCSVCLAIDRPFNLPPTERRVLPSGLVIILMEKRDLPLVDLQILIPIGSAEDPRNEEGLANLTASLLRKGTRTRSAQEIADQVDLRGAELSVATREDRIILSMEVMSADAGFASALLADLIENPTFTQEEFDKEKQNVLASLESDKDDVARYASMGFRRFLLGDHPYAHPVKGYSESLSRIQRSDVELFHKKSFSPKNAILAVVGDFDAEQMLSLLRRDFSHWKIGRVEGNVTVQPPVAVQGRRVCIVDKPDATQTQLRIGNVAFARKSADYFPGLVSNAILGGVFSSRLMTEVRVNRGLTYTIFSRFAPLKDGGVFTITTFTKTETTGDALSVIIEQMDRLVSGGVREEELAKVKSYLNGQFPLSLETPEAIANLLLEVEFYGLPQDYAARFRHNVDSITKENVADIARRYFGTANIAVLALGKASEISPQLEAMAKPEIVDIDWKPLGSSQ